MGVWTAVIALSIMDCCSEETAASLFSVDEPFLDGVITSRR
jgi:hypothetical protein